MTMRKLMNLNRLAAVAGLALALPGVAEAKSKPPKVPTLPEIGVPYTVNFTASRTITWKIPKHYNYTDCGRKWWHAGSGSETWEVAGRGAGRVDVNARAGEVQFLYPGSTADGLPRFWIDAAGMRKRAGRVEAGYDAVGPCEVETPQPAPPESDCGTRLPDYRIVLYYGGGKLFWTLAPSRNEDQQGKLSFDRCPIFAPDPIVPTDFTQIAQPVSYKKISGRRSFTVNASRSWNPGVKDLGREGKLTTSAKVQWTAKFTRVKR